MEEQLRQLIEKGKAVGHLIFDDVSDILPSNLEPIEIERILEMLDREGITLLDTAEQETSTETARNTATSTQVMESNQDIALLRRLQSWGIPATDAVTYQDDAGIELSSCLIVPGQDALRAWAILRSRLDESQHWPLIEGRSRGQTFLECPPHILDGPFTRQDLRNKASSLIAQADAIKPEPWTFRTWRQFQHRIPELLPAVYYPSSPAPRNPSFKELAWVLEQKLIATHDPLGETPYPYVRLSLAPTVVSWEVFAYWPFGGWNDAPWPEEQLAMVRHWEEKFGAELISCADDYFEMVVWNPPRTETAALRLAQEQICFGEETIFAYGNITDEERIRRALDGRHWYFWWD